MQNLIDLISLSSRILIFNYIHSLTHSDIRLAGDIRIDRLLPLACSIDCCQK